MWRGLGGAAHLIPEEHEGGGGGDLVGLSGGGAGRDVHTQEQRPRVLGGQTCEHRSHPLAGGTPGGSSGSGVQ